MNLWITNKWQTLTARGNKQLLISAIRRFYRYTLRNFFLAQPCDMHVPTIASSRVARTNTKARFRHSQTTSVQRKNVRKIVTEMYRWNPENCILSLLFMPCEYSCTLAYVYYRINQQKLSGRSAFIYNSGIFLVSPFTTHI